MGFINAKMKVSKNTIPSVQKKYLGAATKAAEQTANDIVYYAEAFAPKLTTFLSSHIIAEVNKGTGGILANIGYKSFKVYTEAYYDIFQEFGTSHNQAHPFIYPAITIAWPDFIRRLKAWMN